MNNQQLTTTDFRIRRQEFLDKLKQEQDFRVSKGKSKWHQYTTFNQTWDLREILDDEVVIEFDMPKEYEGRLQDFRNEVSLPAVNDTCIELTNAGLSFDVWDHKGKSPHIHIRNLDIKHLDYPQRTTFKKVFTKKFVPEKYHMYADYSLCNTHLVSIEWSYHWKGKYSWKKLLFEHKAEETQ